MHINKHDSHILPVKFEYHAPETVEEVIELLMEHGEEARLLAGGTDLLVKMKQRLLEPRHLINLKKIDGLNGIEERHDGVHIGAVTRLRDLERSEVIRDRLPLLHEAVKAVGSVQIRNMATVGGNICNASPSADAALALIALDAKIDIAGSKGMRRLPLEEFFLGPGQTLLEAGEMLVNIVVSPPAPGSGSAFIKLGRTSLDLATISIATILTLKKGAVDLCRIAMGAVAPTPLRAREAEEFLKGKELTGEVLSRAAKLVSEAISPITDIRSTAEYRRAASKGLTLDALTRAAKAAGGSGS
ncbi:xanthine dehydrogenase family protein subunit M [Candidatus Bathyarchaeota archaeon]|nr:MAG: xanthine dehydrogenase family protein subunit M [Candidatus Bathyarchaeota archaeon]